jgi:hypothetical protein
MGMYPGMDRDGHYSYRLIYGPAVETNLIYFDTSMRGIHELAFENHAPPLGAQQLELPLPSRSCRGIILIGAASISTRLEAWTAL